MFKVSVVSICLFVICCSIQELNARPDLKLMKLESADAAVYKLPSLKYAPSDELKRSVNPDYMHRFVSFDVEPELESRRKGMGNAIVLGSLIAFELIALGSSLISMNKYGAYGVGGFFAVTSATLLVMTFTEGFDDGGIYRLMLSAGLGVLAYYNFRFAEAHSHGRKFWTNFGGLHGVVGVVVLSILAENWISSGLTTGSGTIQTFAGLHGVGFRVRL